MTKAARLRKDARESCEWRGHDMVKFWQDKKDFRGRGWVSICRNCPASVVVLLNPMPNQTNIMGDAVALNCPVPGYDPRP